jgi:uncharacterized protein (DUF736 family)
MAVIGRFTAELLNGFPSDPDARVDALRGSIRTLILDLPLIYVRRASLVSPGLAVPCDWFVTAGPDHIRCGAGWDKKTDAGLAYIALRLDDPTFTQPIDCALFNSGEPGVHAFNLVWNRRKREAY